MMGYKTETRTIKHPGRKNITLNIGMRIKVLKLQGVIVSAKKDEFKKSARISPVSLSHRELETAPSFIEGDLMRTLETMPGVTKTSDFSSAISVRGGGPDQNLVLLDNIPLLNVNHLFGLVSAFNIDAISNVKLWASGIPIAYDASLSSVLDVHSRGAKSEIKGLSGSTSLSLLSSKLTIGTPLSFLNSNILISARRTYADKLLKLFHYNLPYYFYDGYFHSESHIDNWVMVLSGFRGKDLLDLKNEDDPSMTIVKVGWDNTVGALNLFHSVGKKGLFHIATGWSNYNFNMRIMDTLSVMNTGMNVGSIIADYSQKFGGQKLTIGLKEQYRPFDYNVSFLMGLNYSFSRPWINLGSVYIEDEFSPIKKLMLSGGVSFTHYYSKCKDFHISHTVYPRAYRLSGKYFLSDLRALTFSFGNFHQYVVPASLGGKDVIMPLFNWVPLSGNYEPEEAYHTDIGYEGWFNSNYYFAIDGYYKNYSHLLEMKDASNIEVSSSQELYETMFQDGSGKSYGIDVIIKKEVGNIKGWLSYSFLRTYLSYDTLKFPADWDRNHNFHFVLLSVLPWNMVSALQLSYTTGNPYTGVVGRYLHRWEKKPGGDDNPGWWEVESKKNGLRFPPYLRLDVSADKTFYLQNKTLNLKLSIYNLLNYKNVLFYYRDYDTEPPVQKSFYDLPIIPSVEIKFMF
ncbi:MAG: hypothetical protein B5M53_11360 [Candidatus Cloacimonas sp. 4484_209]|nr:MAG: hypothetical protein B5M53_11360 [Candidatus Cloacimonas sp. 4484_209]